MKLKSEEYCGRRFNSLKALDKHMMTSEQHEKTISPSPQNCVKSNQGPWCERTFKNKNAAQAHVYRASRDGECQGQKLKDKNLLMRGKKVMSDDSYCCKNCQIEFDSLQAYHLHIRLHGNPSSKLVNSPSELEQDGGIWRSQAEPEKASDGKQHRRTIKKSTNGTRVNIKRTNSASAIGKTSPKDHQTGAVLRAMTLHFLMLDKSMPWIPLMQRAHQHHVAAQQQAQD